MAKTTKPLTATEIDKARPKDKPYRLYDGEGLLLSVAASGTKTWYFKYKRPYTNKEDMYNIGRYPTISLSEARKIRQDCQELLAKNIDPKQNEKDMTLSEQQKHENTFGAIYHEWVVKQNYSPTTLEKSHAFTSEIIARFGNKPISDITVGDCMAVLTPIEKAGHYTKLQKMRTKISQVMTYAIATGRAKENPAIHLRGVFGAGDVRHAPAILEESRLAELVDAIYGYHGQFVTRQILKFALLVFTRTGEIRNMTWEQVDLDKGIWDYTPPKTKDSTKVKLIVPLSRQAIDVLKEMRIYTQAMNTPLVFPSSVNIARPLSENTINQAIKRMGFDDHTGHGFRATARTLLEEKLKYDYRMIEMQLGHQVRDSNGRAYNRVQWLDERRAMMQAWADYLEGLMVAG